jgi:hypothetical protein
MNEHVAEISAVCHDRNIPRQNIHWQEYCDHILQSPEAKVWVIFTFWDL